MEHLLENYYETISILLFGIGFMNLLLQKNLIRKFIGLNIMDTAVYLFLASKGFIFGRIAPITGANEVASVEKFINPIPAGLVLTGIVVSVSTTAFSLALILRLYKQYHTFDLDKIMKMAREEEKYEC